MERVQNVFLMLERGEHMITIDLKDAYLAIPVAKDMYKYLTFQVGGKHFNFHRLSFGLSFAPYVFTKFLKVENIYFYFSPVIFALLIYYIYSLLWPIFAKKGFALSYTWMIC